jgi:hypothetical protein
MAQANREIGREEKTRIPCSTGERTKNENHEKGKARTKTFIREETGVDSGQGRDDSQ